MKKGEFVIKQWLREKGVYFGKKVKINHLDEFFEKN